MDDPRFLPPERDLPPRRLSARKEHLVQEITARPRRVRRLVLAAAAATVALVVMGFGAYALTREPTHVDSIGCYDRADLGANVTVVGSTGTDPVKACADLWRAGAVAPTTDPPQLTACVLDTGAVAVMPGGTGICEGLGISSLSREARERLTRLGDLNAALAAKLGEGSGSRQRGACVGEEDARRIVRAELDARGYSDWTIEVEVPFDVERRCASASLEPSDRVVNLISLSP